MMASLNQSCFFYVSKKVSKLGANVIIINQEMNIGVELMQDSASNFFSPNP